MAYNKNLFWKLTWINVLATAGTLALGINFPFGNTVFAENIPSNIKPDQTLGNENSQVIPDYNGSATEALKGGAVRGENLFHSFQEFNVSEGRTAIFLKPEINTNIRNILVRVTGSNRSDILGNINTAANFSNANLFLINPNGLYFGSKASLNLSGSFIGTTASGITFPNDIVFSATSPQPLPLLNINVPMGLQFGRNAGGINVQGKLEVPTGKTLALVGGNVNLNGGSLTARSGQIAVGGILEAGNVKLDLDSNNQPLSFADNAALADLSLENNSLIDVSTKVDESINYDNLGSGSIQLNGRQITLNKDSQVIAYNLGTQPGRTISIQAERLTLQNGANIGTLVGFRDSKLVTGDGGNVEIKATDFVEVIGISSASGNPSALYAYTFSQGNAGKLTINTRNLIVEGGGNVSTTAWEGSTGNGGTLELVDLDLVKLSGTSPASGLPPSGLFTQALGQGKAGNLIINTSALIVQDGAVITSGTGAISRGDGGILTINATDFIELSGTASNGLDPSGLFASSRGSGSAGSIFITTGKLNVSDRATVTVETLGGGDAGTIDINAREINLDNRATLKATTRSGNGGDINLQIENQLLLRRNSSISTTAGTIGSTGNGGNININMPDGFIITVPGENSDITANAFDGTGGNVNINAFRIYGIEAREKENPLTNDITASSEFGVNGTVKIDSPEADPNQRSVNLSTQNVEPKLAQVCQAAFGKNPNSFTITGRGGLPSSPDEVLSSDAVLTEWIAVDNVEKSSNTITNKISTPTETKIVEATGWKVNSQGNVVLTANTPTALHNSWQKSNVCN
ncbi:two-partner secretion domain-containing protein [Anabaena azotica]|uniref:Filamentous hemagglutinin N-terminal domain-containing protein n=1 Tax=Anabaena azotica FACHB-119 TaxID=947527 RepID=A0ABR8D321_9NOST|nr:filamentous hemagglutinin N-terminal domain-containing protein [Anabaena azotica]MBD2501542.1 filamentous hemagglutinin N-terminal domain-containing protein [Anabaena azotica FACHB-119]